MDAYALHDAGRGPGRELAGGFPHPGAQNLCCQAVVLPGMRERVVLLFRHQAIHPCAVPASGIPWGARRRGVSCLATSNPLTMR